MISVYLLLDCKASRYYLRKAPRRVSSPLRHPCPHRLRTTRLKRCSALTRRHLADFASHFPILQWPKMVCHAGAADVPCRRGRRAVPAWQILRPHVVTKRCFSEMAKCFILFTLRVFAFCQSLSPPFGPLFACFTRPP